MQSVEQIGKVLEMIVCPACRGCLELRSHKGAASSQSIVRCTACGKSYPIEDGIPVLLVARGESSSMGKES